MNNYLAAVLQSIKPMYCFMIAYGIKAPVPVPNSYKRYEVRKTMPKVSTPFKTYVYCSKHDGDGCIPAGTPLQWLGKVVFEYVCDEIQTIYADDFNYGYYYISDDDLKLTGLSREELWEYGKGQTLYLWHISDLVIYDEPKELSEFRSIDKKMQKECQFRFRYYVNPELCNCANLPAGFACSRWVQTEFCRPYEIEKCECLKSLTRPPQSWCYVKEAV